MVRDETESALGGIKALPKQLVGPALGCCDDTINPINKDRLDGLHVFEAVQRIFTIDTLAPVSKM